MLKQDVFSAYKNETKRKAFIASINITELICF